MKIYALISLIILTLLFSACAKKTEFILLPQEDGKVGKIVISEDGKEVVLDKAWQKVDTANLEKKEILSKEIVEAQYNSIFKSMPKAIKIYRFYFASNSSEVKGDATDIITEILKKVKANKVLQIDVIGYSDSAGNYESNKVLSLKRAKNVMELLTKEGIDEKLISLDYYGEANPLIKTADGVAEEQNRRVEITIK